MELKEKLFIEDMDVKGRTVIVRVDFNVPLNAGRVENDKRIRAALPTIEYLKQKGARTILMSHLGRPRGQVVESLRMAPVAKHLGDMMGSTVKYVDECVGPKVKSAVDSLQEGEILLLENLRFHPEEEKNDPDFARQLAEPAHLYVNDAFGTAHRAHASTEGVTHYVEKAAMGYLMKRELDYLGKALAKPGHPYVAILGGAKVSDKIQVIESLLPLVDRLLIGGGMVYTFLLAKGHSIGKSIREEDKVELARELLKKGEGKIVLPTDFLVSNHFDFENRIVGETKVVSEEHIPDDSWALDIGPESMENFSRIIREAKTVCWNGPMGVFEIEATSHGTFDIARAMAAATVEGAITVVGGGDSASAVKKAGLSHQVSHVSTGGGASLEFLEGRKLPGVEALTDQ